MEYNGVRHDVISLTLANGDCPAGEFLESLDDTEGARVLAIIQRLGDEGVIHNEQQFKKIEDTALFEIKRHQVRIFCFFAPDRRIVLLYGVRKKKDKHKPAHIRRAEEYRQYYLRQNKEKK